MNKPVTTADLVTPKVTTGPLPASRKVYSQPEAAPDLRVPLREIALDAPRASRLCRSTTPVRTPTGRDHRCGKRPAAHAHRMGERTRRRGAI